MDPIFNLKAVRADLDEEKWEDSMDDNGMQERSVFVGTVFDLMPSGKYYTPWACSNVAGDCPVCHGTGQLPPCARPRLVKRAKRRYERLMAAAMARPEGEARRAYAIRTAPYMRRAQQVFDRTCPACDGLGSRSAAQDEIWLEQAEQELNSIGCYLTEGDGDPCDIFAVESRDKEPEETT